MLLRHVVSAFLLATLFAGPARAETMACPDLRNAVQVGGCPTEEELKFTYIGYCSEDSRAYRLETGVCVDYQDYRKLKNVALWESKDGRFQSYVSCETPAKAVRAAKLARIAYLSAKRGESMNRFICDYGDGVQFALRTHAVCKIEGDGSCAAGALCTVNCE